MAAIEVEKVGGVAGCVLHKSEMESIWMRGQMEMSGSNLLLVPDQGHPFLLFRCSRTCSCS